jgi:hypothetical protein
MGSQRALPSLQMRTRRSAGCAYRRGTCGSAHSTCTRPTACIMMLRRDGGRRGRARLRLGMARRAAHPPPRRGTRVRIERVWASSWVAMLAWQLTFVQAAAAVGHNPRQMGVYTVAKCSLHIHAALCFCSCLFDSCVCLTVLLHRRGRGLLAIGLARGTALPAPHCRKQRHATLTRHARCVGPTVQPSKPPTKLSRVPALTPEGSDEVGIPTRSLLTHICTSWFMLEYWLFLF